MANEKQFQILMQGVDASNYWTRENPGIKADLSEANLKGADLTRANLVRANLMWADLRGADLREADLREANLGEANLMRANLWGAHLNWANLWEARLSWANLSEANLSRANFNGATLMRANLSRADLKEANLRGVDFTEATLARADLSEADLSHATLVCTNLEGTKLTGCLIYGISAWDLQLDGAEQSNLVITPNNEPPITVDNMDVAQFLYLLLKNERIRDLINTIGERGVLILGRFTQDRKHILDAIRSKLREMGYVPILFDFEKPGPREFTETIMTLAGLCRFIIADITNPSSSPLELQTIIPNYMIPLLPIIQEGERPFSMFKDLKGKYDWVLDVLVYDSKDNLISVMEKAVIRPCLEKSDQLMEQKIRDIRLRHSKEYL